MYHFKGLKRLHKHVGSQSARNFLKFQEYLILKLPLIYSLKVCNGGSEIRMMKPIHKYYKGFMTYNSLLLFYLLLFFFVKGR